MKRKFEKKNYNEFFNTKNAYFFTIIVFNNENYIFCYNEIFKQCFIRIFYNIVCDFSTMKLFNNKKKKKIKIKFFNNKIRVVKKQFIVKNATLH